MVERALEQARLRTENILLREEWSRRYGFPRIIGESEAIKRAVAETQRVAQTEANVLLLGESGTGKELFARAVHHLSDRRDKPFVAINCAAIPETLIENELFGHERGAFTGAGDRRLGKFELASSGTVFLDEIGELPLAVQGKLLRVIEEKVVDRIGGRAPVPVDVRVVAATNKDLKAAVENGRVSWRSVFPARCFSRLRFRRCAIAEMTSLCWQNTLRPNWAKNCGDVKRLSASSYVRRCAHIVGREMFANLRTRSSAPASFPIHMVLEPEDLGLRAPDDDSGTSLTSLDLNGTLSEVAQRALRFVEQRKIAASAAKTTTATRSSRGRAGCQLQNAA